MPPDRSGLSLLVVWAAGIQHMAKYIEPAFREGFGAAQMGAVDHAAAWEESASRAAFTGNMNHADWALRLIDREEG